MMKIMIVLKEDGEDHEKVKKELPVMG